MLDAEYDVLPGHRDHKRSRLGPGMLGPFLMSVAITFAIAATFAHVLIDPEAPNSTLPSWLDRFAGNNIILAQAAIFVFGLVYEVFVLIANGVERRQFSAAAAGRHQRRGWWDQGRDRLFGVRAGHADEITRISQLPPEKRDPLVQALSWRFDQEERARRFWAQFVTWLLPISGFIGTVIGISEAISNLELLSGGVGNGGTLASRIGDVLAGLQFAFDTTLAGLVLLVPMMLFMLAVGLSVSSTHSVCLANLLSLGNDSIVASKPAADAPPPAAMPALGGAHSSTSAE